MNLNQIIKELENLQSLVEEIKYISNELNEKEQLTEKEAAQLELITHLKKYL